MGGRGWFLRCSPDHHNMLITPGPVPYLNHYALAGYFFEQFADMDYIEDDDAWQPGDWDQPGWSLWGNEHQPEVFFKPRDMAEIIHGFQQRHG